MSHAFYDAIPSFEPQSFRPEQGAKASLPVIAYTFEPHPAGLFAPQPPRSLMPLDLRVERLKAVGCDQVLIERFTRELAAVEAEDWVRDFLVTPLRPAHVVVGFNFTYGRARVGNPAHLREMGERYGFGVSVVEPVRVGEVITSSTEIRRALSEGRVADAAAMLGRPYRIYGNVVTGDARGRKMGFPTANLHPEHEQLPPPGVYASWLSPLDSEERWPSVTNIGVRPTFGGDPQIKVETHVLDGSPDLYGKRVAVELPADPIRPERRFAGPEALEAQIRQDVASARAILEQG